MNGLIGEEKGSLMTGGRLPRGKAREFALQEGSGENQTEAEGVRVRSRGGGQELTPGKGTASVNAEGTGELGYTEGSSGSCWRALRRSYTVPR